MMLTEDFTQLTINASRIGQSATGMYVYARAMAECIARLVPGARLVTTRKFGEVNGLEMEYVPGILGIETKVSRLRPLLWYFYSKFSFRTRGDAIISPTHHAIPGTMRQIITIHDLRPYYNPDSIMQQVYFRYLLPRTAKHLDGILTVSQLVKKEICEVYGVPAEKVHVVGNVVDLSRFSPLSQTPKSGGEYLLVIGANWNHKNIEALIDHCDLWSRRFRLKILCNNPQYRQFLSDRAAQMEITERVEFIARVPEEELITLYQQAAALVHPSLNEGFGLPLYEAIACGIPVLASDLEVFRENLGDVPIYFNLQDDSSWATAFATLDHRADLQSRIDRGLLLVEKFSADAMCRQLTAALQAVWPQLQMRA
ncbi:MAG: glycosyltransferase family 4 protein [Candidatus Marinimicrobia bacterium]|nr:glycosyltransferase family 4 protein [Candidatus Neomarinimicrobiota bacterium]